MEFSNSIAAEVHDLHQFFQDWFNGVVTKDEITFSRVATVWTGEFTLIDPKNEMHNAACLLSETFSLHGAFPQLKIDIRNLIVRVNPLTQAAIAIYEEWHTNVSEIEGRLCSATIVYAPNDATKIRWLHIHESAIASCTQNENG
jgi:hypothetical protein